MKIVVRIPNWIGDAVLSLPALESLKRNYPRAELWLAGREWAKDLFSPNDFGVNALSLAEVKSLKTLKDSSQKLREFGFEIGLLLPNSFSSALLFYLAKIPQRWGYNTDSRRLFLTNSVSPQEQESGSHQVYYYLNLLKGLGLETQGPEIRLAVSSAEKEAAKKELVSLGWDMSRPLIILNPGATYGPAKRWPPSKFAELARLFQERKNAEIIVSGSSDEAELSAAINSALKKPPKSLIGKTTLRQLLAVISHAALFITNDSGPMHLANAMKTPVVAIFGPTDPKLTGPFQQPASVIKKDVPCWPCSYRTCPYDHRCMLNISAEEVFEASQIFLS